MAEAAKETAKALKAKEEYLLLGPGRSLAKLAKAMGRADSYVALLERWSAAHGWQEKAKEYDKEQAAARRAEIEAQRREMDKEHALWGHEQALKAMSIIEEINAARKFTSQAAVQLFKYATDLQRIALGSATEQIALTGKDNGPIDLDIVVETFWGRGTDPRRKSEHIREEPAVSEEDSKEDEEDQGEDEEFGAEVPEDDE